MTPIERVRKVFDAAPFLGYLGVEVREAGEGVCETSLALQRHHLQQTGVAHAGVLATIADHTAGGAALTVLPEGKGIVSIEFKINLLRPADGERLRCRAIVLKPGRNISVVESEVYSVKSGTEKLAAKATVTLAIVDWS